MRLSHRCQAAVLSTPLQHPRPGPSAFTPVDLGSPGIVLPTLEEFMRLQPSAFQRQWAALGDVWMDGGCFSVIDAPNEFY